MRTLYRYGGLPAGLVVIAPGAGSVNTGIRGRDRVGTDLAREKIVGPPDSASPGRLVDTGAEAQAFANVMRKHTLEATGGKTYAEMPRFLDVVAARATNDESAAAKDPKSDPPVAKAARDIWVTSTALQDRAARRRTSPRAWPPSPS